MDTNFYWHTMPLQALDGLTLICYYSYPFLKIIDNMALNTQELNLFLEAYPEVPYVFGVSNERIVSWLKSGKLDSPFPNIFPIVEFERHSLSIAAGPLAAIPGSQVENLSQKYQDLFAARVHEILSFVGPRTPAQRQQELRSLRNEFMCFPEHQVRLLDADIASRKVASWEDIPTREQVTGLREYGMEAIEEYGQESVPSFDAKIHLNENFEGFVRGVKIYDFSKPWSSQLVLEADMAFIRNGKILWHSSCKSVGQTPSSNVTINWRDPASPNFELQESYYKRYTVGGSESQLTGWARHATFKFSENQTTGEIEITYDGSTFYIRIKRDNQEYPENVDSFTVKKETPTFDTLWQELLRDPNFASSPANLRRIFPDQVR